MKADLKWTGSPPADSLADNCGSIVFFLCSFWEWRRCGSLRAVQTVCKPGFVPTPAKPGREIAIHLGRPLPNASRDLPGQRRGNPPVNSRSRAAPIRSCSRWGLPCRRRRRRRGALLPHPFTLAAFEKAAVCSLWHFPWGRPRRPLAGTVFPWSPDFPPPDGFPHCRKAAIRPSGPS